MLGPLKVWLKDMLLAWKWKVYSKVERRVDMLAFVMVVPKVVELVECLVVGRVV